MLLKYVYYRLAIHSKLSITKNIDQSAPRYREYLRRLLTATSRTKESKHEVMICFVRRMTMTEENGWDQTIKHKDSVLPAMRA